MRLCFWPSPHQRFADIVTAASHAELTGWSGLYLADHFMVNTEDLSSPEVRTVEVTAAISALAALTNRLTLGTLVLGNTYRHPAVVAKWAASADEISDGRLILGIGAGWQRNEHRQYGIDLPAPKDLVDRFEEACAVLTGLFREPRTTFDGTYYSLADAECEPKPVQDPLPLLIGGKGNRMLGIAARYADAWNMWATPETLQERMAVLDQHCETIGRDPAAIRRSVQAIVHVTDDAAEARRLREATAPRPCVVGISDEFADMVGRWLEVGADEVIVPDFAMSRGEARLEEMDRIRAAVADLITA